MNRTVLAGVLGAAALTLTAPAPPTFSSAAAAAPQRRHDARVAMDYDRDRAALRVRVTPKHASVHVDGSYAGTADDFDGAFQRLYLDPGEREIVLRLEGHRSETRRVRARPGRTVSLDHEMTPLAAGETTTTPEPEPAAEAGAERARRGEREGRRPPGTSTSRDSAPTARFGTLVVRVLPEDAEIYVDGWLWGSAEGFEQLVVHLAAGRHRIEIRRAGRGAFAGEVEIQPGEETPLNVRLDESR